MLVPFDSLPGAVVLDPRPKMQYLTSHIPNSQHVDLERIIQLDQYGSHLVRDPVDLASLFGSLGIDETKSVLILGEPQDPSAARLAWTLEYLGHPRTFLVEETWQTLQNSGIDLTSDVSSPTKLPFRPNVNPDVRATFDQIKNSTDAMILDARSPYEFLMGHIPDAVSVPFLDGLGTTKLFQDRLHLKRLFESHNIDNNREIICYCSHGHRAASLYCQLKTAGYDNVKVYDGSFVEWCGRNFSS